jgi:hypothetical protein
MLPDDDVSRLYIAVQHAPAVRAFDRVAHIHESGKQSAQFERAATLVLLQGFTP